MTRARRLWQLLRQLAGDDAYEQYLQHFFQVHARVNAEAQAGGIGALVPLDRKAFYLERQRQKWSGVQRCC